ncbi:MAG TPA: hypothetical protein VLF62_00795 [Candidatus Saccharimonadales bacterium]|nr:hypothetical protein [Candidatus Saccharimonadales bacterium]
MPLFKKRPVKLTPPAARADTFVEGWREVVTKYAPETPAQPFLIINVAKAAVDWVRQEVRPETRGFSEGDMYANALLLGTLCLFAGQRDETPFLVTPDGKQATLPLMSEYHERASNSTYKITVPPQVFSADTWAHFDGGNADWVLPGGGGPGTQHLVHAGIHILGAMTQLPEGSGLMVRPEHDNGGPTLMRPPLRLAGAPSFPEDIAFTPPA